MRHVRHRMAIVAIAAASLGGMLGAGTPARADVATEGLWSAPFSPGGMFDENTPQTIEESMMFPTAASAVVLPFEDASNVTILYWNGLQDLEDAGTHLTLDGSNEQHKSDSKTVSLNLLAGDAAGAPIFLDGTLAYEGDDLFCSDQRLQPDGRVIVAGGTNWQKEFPTGPTPVDSGPAKVAELYGSKQTRIFNSQTGMWSLSPNEMSSGRWYPALLTQGDGTLFVTGGVTKLVYNNKGFNENQAEIFDPETDTWTKIGSDSSEGSMPLYPRLHLLPSGDVFYSGSGQMWGPAGQANDEAIWNVLRSFDTTEAVWTPAGLPSYGARSGAFSVLLPLSPPYEESQILVGGGILGVSPGTFVATPLSEVITVGADGAASSSPTPTLNNARWFSSAVLLPNGNVVAVNGAADDEVVFGGYEPPVRQAELWNGSEWVPLSSGARDRTYHNSAILLPDGTVLVGGHAPINQGYSGTGTASQDGGLGVFAQNFKDPSFERLYPPYLFEADGSPAVRPEITDAPNEIAWGEDFQIETSGEVSTVVLQRFPSVTHTTDADMRVVELPFEATDDALVVSGPPSGNVAPPGWYYLFALDADGTPSIAEAVVIEG